MSYKDYFDDKKYHQEVAIIIYIIITALFILLAILFFINKQLKNNISASIRNIEESKNKLDKFINIITDNVALIRINSKGKICYISDKFKSFFKQSDLDSYIDKDLITQFPYIQLEDDVVIQLKNALRNKNSFNAECLLTTDPEKQNPFEFSLCHLNDNNQNEPEVVMIFTDITERRHNESLSLSDALTQIANRRALNNTLATLLNESTSETATLSVIMADIDYFKRINDQYGHNMGDAILKTLAKTLVNLTPKDSTIGRWGGEEFLLICPSMNRSDAENIAEKIRMAVQEMSTPTHQHITISLGVAQIKANESLDHFISRADQALYEAKLSGRNCVKVNRD